MKKSIIFCISVCFFGFVSVLAEETKYRIEEINLEKSIILNADNPYLPKTPIENIIYNWGLAQMKQDFKYLYENTNVNHLLLTGFVPQIEELCYSLKDIKEETDPKRFPKTNYFEIMPKIYFKSFPESGDNEIIAKIKRKCENSEEIKEYTIVIVSQKEDNGEYTYLMGYNEEELKAAQRKKYEEEYGGIVFKDIDYFHPLFKVSYKANKEGWLKGYDDGELKPERLVNRAEFAKMLMLAFKKIEREEPLAQINTMNVYLINGVGKGYVNNLAGFPDIKKGEWYVPYLSKAVEEKVMKGYGDGTMKPERNITLAEALKMIFEIKYEAEIFPYDEEHRQWYDKYMDEATYYYGGRGKNTWQGQDYADLALLRNNPDPNHEMTREDCIILIDTMNDGQIYNW